MSGSKLLLRANPRATRVGNRLPGGVLAALSLSIALVSFVVPSVTALPAGRAWARWERFAYPGLDPTYGIPVLMSDSTGIPLLYIDPKWDTAAAGGPTRFTWRDSSWADPVGCLPYAEGTPALSLSLDRNPFIAWRSWPEDNLYHPRMVAAVLGATCSPAETVMVTTSQDFEYGAASSARRRWIARGQQRVPLQTTGIRVTYSDTAGIWHEVHDVAIDDGMCDIAPLDDTTAIVAYGGGKSGLAWAVLRGGAWADSGNIDPRPYWAVHPRFRFRPSGGLDLVWTDDRDRMHVSYYVNGQMSRGDSIIVPRPPGDTYTGAWCAASRDTAERPTLVWGENGYAYTYRDIIAVSVPNDSSWDYGEEVPGSEGANIPTVARDRNGDVWVGWRNLRMGITGMTHSYTAVTCSAPQVSGAGRDRIVSWSLSGAAPHSWWSVLRARGDGPFISLARVETGHDTLLSWTDRSAPMGILRYRIQRECLDTRHGWTSDEGRWPPKSQRPLALGPIPSPSLDSVVLDVADAAAGAVTLRLYDVQGRLLRSQRMVASGLGHDTFRFDVRQPRGRVAPGMYFLRIEDSSGQVSDAAKVVILK